MNPGDAIFVVAALAFSGLLYAGALRRPPRRRSSWENFLETLVVIGLSFAYLPGAFWLARGLGALGRNVNPHVWSVVIVFGWGLLQAIVIPAAWLRRCPRCRAPLNRTSHGSSVAFFTTFSAACSFCRFSRSHQRQN